MKKGGTAMALRKGKTVREGEAVKEGFTEGPFHIIRTADKWRVVGRGFCISCRDERKAGETLEKVRRIWEN